MESRPQNPFKGLQPYQQADSNKLFGRDKDLVLIKSRIFSARTTLLFAGSGVGKSSFINAKIIPDLKSQFYIHSINVWSGPTTPLDQDKNSQIKAEIGAYLEALEKAKRAQAARKEPADEQAPPQEAQVIGPTLPALLRNFLDLPPDFESRATSGCLLILDQFEEIFQSHAYQDYFKTFLYNLSYVINRSDLPVRIIFSMREEFLGELSIFDNRIPDLFNNYYRLKYPDRDAATDIIKSTSRLVEVPVDETNLAQLVRDLSTFKKGPASFAERSATESNTAAHLIESDFIMPPYLQISCQKLWQKQFQSEVNGADADKPFLATYKPYDAQAMLSVFFDEKIKLLTPAERDLAYRTFNYLVTKQGAKMAYELTVLAELMEMDKAKLLPTLLKLSQDDTKILRMRPAPDGLIWFELYHDMYGPIVDDWRTKYHKDKRLRIRNYILAGGAALALIIAVVSVWSYCKFKQNLAEDKNHIMREVRSRVRALDAEIEEDRDKTILYRLQALVDTPPDSLEAKEGEARVINLIGDDYNSLITTYRPSDPAPAANALFSTDGKMVLTQSTVGDIFLWETESGKPLSLPANWSEKVLKKSEAAGTMEEHGNQVAPLRRKAKNIFRSDTEQEPQHSSTSGSDTKSNTLPGRASIKALTNHPQYGLLIAGIYNNSAGDNGLYIWRADTGEILGDKPLRLQVKQKRVVGNILIVNFSPDGKYIATEGNANTPIVREIKDGGLNPIPIEGIKRDSYVNYASFSSDSKYLLTGSDDHRAYLWDLSNKTVKFTFQHDYPVRRAVFSPDEKRILTRDDKGYIKIWETETGKQVGRTIYIEEGQYLTSKLEPDGLTVMTRSLPDNKISFWDGASRNRLDAMFDTRESSKDLNFHPNGKYVLVITGGIARLLQVNHVKPSGKLIRDDKELLDYALDPHGKTLMTESGDKVQWWNAEDGNKLGQPADGQILSADGGYFMSFNGPKTAQVRDAATRQPFMQLPNVDSDDVDLFVVSPDNQYLAILSKESIFVWKNDHQNRPVARIFTDKSGTGNINALAFGADGQLLLYGGDDKQLHGLSLHALKPLSYTELNNSLTSPIADVQLSHDGRLMLIGGADNTLLLCETRTGKVLDKVSLGSNITMVEFSPSGNAALVATTSWIHRFDIAQETLVHSSSHLLLDKPSSPFRIMDQDGQKIRTLISHSPGLIQIEDIDFEEELEGPAFPADPKQRLAEWSRKLSLNVERETSADMKAR